MLVRKNISVRLLPPSLKQHQAVALLEQRPHPGHKRRSGVGLDGQTIAGVAFLEEPVMGQSRVAILVVADEVDNGRVPHDQPADKVRGAGSLGLGQVRFALSDVLDADGGVVETDGVAADHVVRRQLEDGAIQVHEVVGRQVHLPAAANVLAEHRIERDWSEKTVRLLNGRKRRVVDHYHLRFRQPVAAHAVVSSAVIGGQPEPLVVEDAAGRRTGIEHGSPAQASGKDD